MRTLNDIEVFEVRQDLELEGVEYPLIDKNDVRKEAINWVKHWLKTLGNPEFFINEKNCVGFRKKDMDRFNITQCEACASIGAFVNFFNLTEEECVKRSKNE